MLKRAVVLAALLQLFIGASNYFVIRLSHCSTHDSHAHARLGGSPGARNARSFVYGELLYAWTR
jgi:hypothetical protein